MGFVLGSTAGLAVVRFAAREKIALREDALITKGFACRHGTPVRGRSQTIEYFLPGDYLEATEDRADAPYSVRALSPVLVISLAPGYERAELRALYQRRALAIGRQWLINIGTRNATQRCAHLLCELFVRLQSAGLAQEQSCQIPLTQADLADSLALTPVHVNRTLKKLRETGLISWRSGVLRIHDFAMLKMLGDFDEHYLTHSPTYEAWTAEHLRGTARARIPERAPSLAGDPPLHRDHA